jgi:hypothetical protein
MCEARIERSKIRELKEIVRAVVESGEGLPRVLATVGTAPSNIPTAVRSLVLRVRQPLFNELGMVGDNWPQFDCSKAWSCSA